MSSLVVVAVVIIVSLTVIYPALKKYISSVRRKKLLDKWTEASKGKLIMHGMYGNSDYLPSVSPFVLKLETFLRYAKIPYELDKSDVWWPEKGKTPWISHNGNHMGDSQFIVEYLKTKFDTPKTKYTEKERAIGTTIRVMVEEHLYWCGVMWRFAFGGKDTFQDVRDGRKKFLQWFIFTMIAPSMKSMAWSQGVGRHSEQEVMTLTLQDLNALSAVLGNNKFIFGDVPCEDDCSIFAGLASAVFNPDSPIQPQLNGKPNNLKEYCFRMKLQFWPDWETVIGNSRSE